VTEGTDAQAEVSVRLAHEGRSMTARAADPDTLVASQKPIWSPGTDRMKRQRDIPARPRLRVHSIDAYGNAALWRRVFALAFRFRVSE